MDTQWLRVLIDLDQLGTLRAVADATGYSTSAVSQQLARLQREVGYSLVEPVGRKLCLTPAGKSYLTHAQTALATLEAARLQLDDSDALRGVLRVAGYTTSLSHYVAPAVRALQRQHAQLDIRMQEREPGEIIDLLARDRIDIGVVYDYSLAPRPGLTHCFAERPMLLTVPMHETRSWQQIIADPDTVWIGNSRAEDDDRLIRHITMRFGVIARIEHHIDNAPLVTAFIAAGHGVAILASDSPHNPAVKYHDVSQLAGVRRSYAVTRPGRQQWPPCATLIATMRAAAEQTTIDPGYQLE